MQKLTGNSSTIVEAARARKAELRAAPMRVLDLRGDCGGSSVYDDGIAGILYGDAVAGRAVTEDACPEAWQASPGSLARLKFFPVRIGGRLTPEANARIEHEIARCARRQQREGIMWADALRGEDPRSTACCASLREPKVIVLTDRVCFRWCLIVVRTLREPGAVQIGETTNADTWYQQNLDEALRSGLTDTAAVELWVARLTAKS